MIDPSNYNYYNKEGLDDKIVIDYDHLPHFNTEEYDLYDEKQFKKYMTDIENNVRQSYEYKLKLHPFLKESMQMNQCSFFRNINNIDMKNVQIEIHHSPFTLYDICRVVYNKRCFYNQAIDVQSVAEEVTLLHYCGLVGLIPLSETVHELVHNGYIFIPTTAVFGRYKDFAEIYDSWLGDLKDTLRLVEEYTEVYDEDKAKNLLSRKYTFLDTIGEYTLPNTHEIYKLVENKIDAIKYQLEDKLK